MSANIEVRPISPTRKNLRRYVDFGIELYKGSPYHVPPLRMDEMVTLDPAKNPAFDFCRAQSFMAYRDGFPAGRITAMVNDVVNGRTGRKAARFGFVDFVDDARVVDALFAAAEKWAREQGMTEMVGPMGFTDMDHEGMLVEGFDEVGTMATIYNYPYYPGHMERMGYGKEVDWVEFRMEVPDGIPDKYERIAALIKRKYDLHTVRFTSRKTLKERYGHALFRLINEAYDGLYGYSPLTERQIDFYIDQYLDFIRLDCVSVVVDKNEELVAVGISMPSLSRALQRSRGRLLPTGWYHLLKAIKGKNPVVDLMLIAVKKEFIGKGVNAMIFCDLLPTYIRTGFRYAESNPELEGNGQVQQQWQYFNYRQHRRRRAWRKDLV